MKKLLSSLLFIFATMFALPAFADETLTNLTDTYWYFKNDIGSGADNSSFWFGNWDKKSVDWTDQSGDTHNGFTTYTESSRLRVVASSTAHTPIIYAYPDGWVDSKYRLVHITGGTDVTDSSLIEKLLAFATQVDQTLASCTGIIREYTSATGTVSQNGTPTPTNPIEPVFYQQGDMILRKVGNYVDSYDATTGKITRRVGVKVFDGTERWTIRNSGNYANNPYFELSVSNGLITSDTTTLLYCTIATSGNITVATQKRIQMGHNNSFVLIQPSMGGITLAEWKSYLAEQYNAGHPVTVYYPLATPVEEDWPSSYCAPEIKIATTAYNAARFSPVQTDLNNAVATIREIVTKTINQTAAIASLQADKQTRPEEQCPAGKKCLLVETEENGVIVPHWYPIIEDVD